MDEQHQWVEEKGNTEERLRMLFEYAPDAYYLSDLKGTFIDGNKAAEEITGYNRKELINKNFFRLKLLSPGQIPKAIKLLLRNARGLPTGPDEFIFTRKDKKKIVLDIRTYPVKISDKALVLGIARDITIRKHMEEELERHKSHLEELIEEGNAKLIESNKQLQKEILERKKSENELLQAKKHFETLARVSPVGIWRSDKNGKWIYINEQCSSIIGLTKQDALGDGWSKHLHQDDKKSYYENWERCLKEHILFKFEYRFLLSDGRIKWVLGQSTPEINYQGQIIGHVGTLTDITERKLWEKELLKAQKLESIGVLAGGIAHDFNNILTAILGNTNLAMMHSERDKRIYDFLQNIEKASMRAMDLTRQFITFSKGGEPVKSVVLLPELIKETTDFALRGSNIKCTLAMTNNIWPVEADKGQISQVIHNLIINAKQAMPTGGNITISAENVTKDEAVDNALLRRDNYVKIAVIDNGFGIPDEIAHKIFDPYFSNKAKGTGLGLASSYSIIKNHRGVITFESTVGKGTSFFVILPASIKKYRKQKDENREEIRSPSRNFKVMVMDDEESIRNLVSNMLTNMGYEVVCAKDGREALGLYNDAKEPFDVIILDLTIPGGMGGSEVISKLRDIDPNVIVIVFSGYSSNPIMSDYKRYGFNGALTKPFTLHEMNKLLSKLIANKC